MNQDWGPNNDQVAELKEWLKDWYFFYGFVKEMEGRKRRWFEKPLQTR